MAIQMVKWAEILDEIDTALEYFESQGVKPTLRTLFYYLVSKQMIPNTRSSYKTLSRQLVKARKKGRYQWDFLEDKTRVVMGSLADSRFSEDELEHFKDRLQDRLESLTIDALLNSYFDFTLPYFYVERWAEQPIVCEVWIEKEALSSTLYSWIGNLNVPIRVNRGYSSWTFIYNNVKNLRWTLEKHDKVIIYYCGDLDPSGMDIQRFLIEALGYFGLEDDRVELKRLAVTSEQVERFNLPPRPEDAETIAKLNRDPRYKSYTLPYIVELDALVAYAPQQFRSIITEAINKVWDKSIYEKLSKRAEELKQKSLEILDDIKSKAKEKVLDDIKGDE